MKFIKLTHYVEKSFEGKPSFVLVMDDDDGIEKSFISNGCVFVENNKENIDSLVNEYDCGAYINELLKSKVAGIEVVVDGRYMFDSCKNLVSFTSEMPNLKDGRSMFDTCKNLESFTSEMPNLKDGRSMFNGCKNLVSFTSEMPNLKDGYRMFDGCIKLNK